MAFFLEKHFINDFFKNTIKKIFLLKILFEYAFNRSVFTESVFFYNTFARSDSIFYINELLKRIFIKKNKIL